MGYLLKEALKTLCGVNQWSYAIFWKIGCQNPKLLIWEECYYENSGTSVSATDFEACSSAEMNNGQFGMLAENRVHFLITKMMMDNHVNVIGEGLIGRAAFNGSHQWILSHNYNQSAYPPEVLNEVFQQFSAGMQTIAVIPVLPHGVVQLASDMPVMENTAFVNDVKNLVLQLGCVPGILLSENYTSNETTPKTGGPVGKSIAGTLKPLANESCNYKGEFADKSTYGGLLNVRSAMSPPSSSSLMPHATQYETEKAHSATAHHTYMTQLANSVAKAEVIPANQEMWLNQPTFGCFPRSNFDMQPSVGLSSLGGCLSMIEQQILAGRAVQEHSSNKLNVSGRLLTSSLPTSSQGFGDRQPAAEGELYGVAMGSLSSFFNFGSFSNANLPSIINDSGLRQGVSRVKIADSPKPIMSSSGVSENSAMNKVLTSGFASGYSSIDNKVPKDVADVIDDVDYDLYKALTVPHSAHMWSKTSSESMSGPVRKEEMEEYGAQGVSTGDITYGVTNSELGSGDDLFDVLGVDLKNKLLNGSWNNSQDSGSESSITNLNKKNLAAVKGSVASADLLALSQGQTNKNMSRMTGKDHLLDAMISSNQSSAKQTLDDNTSCKTTITNTSSSSVPNVSVSGGEVGVSGQMQAELFGFTKSGSKPDVFGSSLFKPEPCKDAVRSYSRGSSLYGSQVSSWIDQDLDHKPSSSVSTGYSKKTDDTGKSNRKRLKPGENPRPRPKDRQMIQDRVKELREIVPNGAKCSIDALLERTIKHMLFLQSVTKHADKLKQTGESKIFSKESGLVTKANCDGGATWAYEVGSKSTVCPIIVEDLNQPRQMLVEMLCEERGLFLEMADIIRGLGLTILKGVMEAQKDKIWARFVVEANRDVTRMEIFISLVRLLEQNRKNGVSATSGIDNDAMTQQFPLPGTSIPATGRSCGL